MGELTSLRYIGGGMTRPELPARDHDRADVRGLSAEAIEAALGSGLYAPTYSDEDPEEAAPEANPADELPDRLLSGPFIWTGSNALANPGAADGADVDPAVALGEASFNDLRKLAKARGLDTSGTKVALIERLVASEPAADESDEEDD